MRKSALLVWFITILSFGFSQSRPLVFHPKHVDLIDPAELIFDCERAEFTALEKRFRLQSYDFYTWIEHHYLARHYQQDSLMLIDPKGDAFLIRKLDTIPAMLLHILFNDPLPQTIVDEEQFKEFEIGKTVPFDVERLINKCRDIILQHYPTIVPTIGQKHDWSPDAKTTYFSVFGKDWDAISSTDNRISPARSLWAANSSCA